MKKAFLILCIVVVLLFVVIPPVTVEHQCYYPLLKDGVYCKTPYKVVIHRFNKTITAGEDVYTYTLKDKVLTLTYPDGVVCTVENFGGECETGWIGEVDEKSYIPFHMLCGYLDDFYN